MAVPICVLGEMDNVEVPIKVFMVDRLLVLPLVIDEPDTIRAILSAVITHSEGSPYLLSPAGGLTIGRR